ncbi:MAG: Esterase [Verrucomicrobiaceae bacterium]|nr:Esterase [Verrucomicrobiaceae bacterium]
MPLDSELQIFERFALPDFADIVGVRRWAQSFSAMAGLLPAELTRDIEISDQTIPGPAGAPAVSVRIYRPLSTLTSAAPVLLYFHGGSFVMGDLDTDHRPCLQYARDARAVVVSVQYRLAPEHRFPAGVEDCYAALLWLAHNAVELGIDTQRIAVGGSSAGGTLAASVAIMARDRNGPAPVLQLLIYPAFDDRMTAQSINGAERRYGVTRGVVGHMWRHYLGESGIASSPYAAPARVTDLTDLAPAYIEAGELDPLRDETIDYALRLLQAGVSTDLRVLAGAPHAFDMVTTAAITQRAFADRAVALRNAFAQ